MPSTELQQSSQDAPESRKEAPASPRAAIFGVEADGVRFLSKARLSESNPKRSSE
jgi:hypothetical protein